MCLAKQRRHHNGNNNIEQAARTEGLPCLASDDDHCRALLGCFDTFLQVRGTVLNTSCHNYSAASLEPFLKNNCCSPDNSDSPYHLPHFDVMSLGSANFPCDGFVAAGVVVVAVDFFSPTHRITQRKPCNPCEGCFRACLRSVLASLLPLTCTCYHRARCQLSCMVCQPPWPD